MKRIIIAIFVLVVLGVGGYLVYVNYLQGVLGSGKVTRTANSYKATQGSQAIEFQDIANPSAVNLGLALYPGAVASTSQGDSSTSVVNGLKMTVLTYTSDDSVNKVVNFYKRQMGSTSVTYDNKVLDRVETTIAKSAGDTKNPLVVVTTDGNRTILRLVKIGS